MYNDKPSWRVSKRRHGLSCICLSCTMLVQSWELDNSLFQNQTSQQSKQPWFAPVLLKSGMYLSPLPYSPVWLLSCPPSLVVRRRAVTSVKGEESCWKKLLFKLLPSVSFLLHARRQVTAVTKTMIYSLAPLDVLNHLVPWIKLGRQPYVFSWVLLQTDSSGFNTNVMIVISGSERTFYRSLWVNKASWLRMRRRKWMLSERVLWLPWRAGWGWATWTCQPGMFPSHFKFKEY